MSADVPTAQTVHVQTPGCPAASCELSNDRGSWHVARTPGSVAVLVSGKPLTVICHAEDSTTGSTSAALSRPGTTGAGGAVGGVAGGAAVGVALGSTALAFFPPLGIIAVLTGAVAGGVAGDAAESQSQQLRYSGLISIPLACQTAGDTGLPSDRGPQILGLTFRGLMRSEARALGLGERTAVVVMAMAAEGPAAASGLRIGDALLALDGLDLSDAADLEEQLQGRPPSAPMALRVWRDRRIVELVLTRVPKERP